MAFELRLTFKGLTALVPRKDASDPSDPSKTPEWLVVMPALQGGDYLSKGNRNFTIAPHQAVLLANDQAVRTGKTTKPVRLQFRDPSSAPNGAHSDLLFQISREVVEINSGTPGLQVRSDVKDGAETPELDQPNQLQDIKWVPSIDKCRDAGVPFNRKLLDLKTLRPIDDSLAGVVRLDRGFLETSGIHLGSDDKGNVKAASYEFRQGSSKGKVRFRQPLAKGFQLRLEVPDETASLTFRDKLGNETFVVVGAYAGCPVNEKNELLVEVRVFNLELEEILGLGAPPKVPRPELGDEDFVIFYKLSSAWEDLTAKDLVLPYLADKEGGGSAKLCEPPQYPGM